MRQFQPVGRDHALQAADGRPLHQCRGFRVVGEEGVEVVQHLGRALTDGLLEAPQRRELRSAEAEEGGTLLDFDPRAMRTYFRQEFEKAKEGVASLQQDLHGKTSTKSA